VIAVRRTSATLGPGDIAPASNVIASNNQSSRVTKPPSVCVVSGLNTLRGDAQANETNTRRENGAGNEVRTRDLNLGKVALYQLSYSRILPV
jgi:hypothetical protein